MSHDHRDFDRAQVESTLNEWAGALFLVSLPTQTSKDQGGIVARGKLVISAS